MADLRDFIPAIKYGASLANSKLDSGKILLGTGDGTIAETTLSGDMTVSNAGVVSIAQGMPFIVTASFGTQDLNSGSVGGTIMSEATLAAYGASDRTVYLTDFYAKCFDEGYSSMSNWVGGTLNIKDSAGTVIWAFDSNYISHDYGVSGGGTPFLLKSKTMAGAVNRGIYIQPASGGSVTNEDGTLVVSIMGIIK